MTASFFLFPFKISSNLTIADLTALTNPRCWFWVLMNFCKGAHTQKVNIFQSEIQLRRGRKLAIQIAIGLFASTPVQWRWMGFCFQALIDGIAASSVAGMKFTTCIFLYILYTLVVLKVFIFLFLGQMFWHHLDWHASLQSSCLAFLFCLNDLRPLLHWIVTKFGTGIKDSLAALLLVFSSCFIIWSKFQFVWYLMF